MSVNQIFVTVEANLQLGVLGIVSAAVRPEVWCTYYPDLLGTQQLASWLVLDQSLRWVIALRKG
jgi:hypothetical protein